MLLGFSAPESSLALAEFKSQHCLDRALTTGRSGTACPSTFRRSQTSWRHWPRTGDWAIPVYHRLQALLDFRSGDIPATLTHTRHCALVANTEAKANAQKKRHGRGAIGYR